MNTRIYWINPAEKKSIAIMPRPRAGDWLEDEIAAYKRESVDIIVSLLEPHEVWELELQPEKEICEAAGVGFLSFPIVDRGVPDSTNEARKFIEKLTVLVREGKRIAIHCRAGIGRSTLIAASVMIHLGYKADDALQIIETSRGMSVPDTEEQRAWVRNYQAL